MSTMTQSQSKHSASANRPQPGVPVGMVTISPEAVRARAYQIYQMRNWNSGAGDQLSDWHQAEQELEDRVRGEVLMKGDQE